jgi:drug/metabolite transporter (DMT)-like permease
MQGAKNIFYDHKKLEHSCPLPVEWIQVMNMRLLDLHQCMLYYLIPNSNGNAKIIHSFLESRMSRIEYSHIKVVLLAVLVTILWSSSFVLVKIGLRDIPAALFAGIRYFIAFLVLAPFVLLSPKRLNTIREFSPREWLRVLSLGVMFYTFTQGASFIGLSLLPAVMVSLLLSFTPFLVAFTGMVALSEKPSLNKWIGLALFAGGIVIFFYPVSIPRKQVFGLMVVSFGVVVNAGSAILGRSINREKRIQPIVLTVVSMGFGSFLLVITGLVMNGVPTLSLRNWIIILWLAVVNTAVAFTLWNYTLRTLLALESSIINNTMLFQVAILAWVFLGEAMTSKQIIGTVVSGAGAVVVQLRSIHRAG